MEKPPGLNPAETRRMGAAAGTTANQVAFNRRYHPLVQRLCAELRALAAEVLAPVAREPPLAPSLLLPSSCSSCCAWRHDQRLTSGSSEQGSRTPSGPVALPA